METSILEDYAPHICRSTAIGKASQLNVDISEILKQSYWKQSYAKTFFNFHKKGIVYYAQREILVKILDFEVSFNQLTENARRNVKLSKYFQV